MEKDVVVDDVWCIIKEDMWRLKNKTESWDVIAVVGSVVGSWDGKVSVIKKLLKDNEKSP